MKNKWDKILALFFRFKDLTTLGFAQLLSNVISVLFWLYIARVIGTEQYGEVSYLIAICSIASGISFFGSANTLIVYTAKGVKIQPPIFLLVTASSALASIILFLIFYKIELSLYVLGWAVFGLSVSELLGNKSYRKYSIYLILQKILMVILSIILYYIIGFNGIILGIALSFFPFSINIFKKLSITKIDFSLIKTRSKFIINSYALDLSRAFSTSIDKLIVAPLFGYVLLGNYQLGVQFLSLLGILPGVVFQYVLPQDASGINNKKLKRMIIFTSIVLAVLGIIVSPIVIPTVFPKFSDAVIIFQIISLSIIPLTLNTTYISKFLAKENSKGVLIGSLLYIIIQIISIIILGKFFGVVGVSTSFVLATTSETLYLYISSHLHKYNE